MSVAVTTSARLDPPLRWVWSVSMAVLAICANATPDLIISNVKFLDRAGHSTDLIVSPHFEDGNLSLVTEDTIETDIPRHFDAAGGVVLDELSLNEASSLKILDQDPRDDFAVPRDTQTHAIFAMESGEVLVNRLSLADRPTGAGRQSSGWLAYAPPPFAVPIRYGDSEAFNRFETKRVSGIFGGALATDRVEWLSQDSGSEQTVGDLGYFSGGEFRALRFSVAGTLNFEKPWGGLVIARVSSWAD